MLWVQISTCVSRTRVVMKVNVSQFSTTTYAYVDLVTAVSDVTIVSKYTSSSSLLSCVDRQTNKYTHTHTHTHTATPRARQHVCMHCWMYLDRHVANNSSLPCVSKLLHTCYHFCYSSLDVHVHVEDSFRRLLKTYLFARYYSAGSALDVDNFMCYINLLTYLLIVHCYLLHNFTSHSYRDILL